MWTKQLGFTEESARNALDALLQTGQLPTAFFCAGDAYAIQIIHCAKEKGIRIPAEVSVMSLDDLFMSRYVDPPLSTMTFDKELVGQKAMQLLYRIISKESIEPVNLIKTTPVKRSSVKQL